MKSLEELMSPEDRERERIWAEQLKQTRAALLERIEKGVSLWTKPKQRKSLYEKWRKTYGDGIARESAKTVEAIIAGKYQIEDYRRALGPQETTKT